MNNKNLENLQTVNFAVRLTLSKIDVYTKCNWCSGFNHRRINKGPGGLGNKRPSEYHPKYCTIEIGENTEKSPGDLRRLAVTQTPVKDHRLTLVWKTIMLMIYNRIVRVLYIDLWETRQSRISGTGCSSCVNKVISGKHVMHWYQ